MHDTEIPLPDRLWCPPGLMHDGQFVLPEEAKRGLHALFDLLGIGHPELTDTRRVREHSDPGVWFRDPRMKRVWDELNRWEHRASQKLACLSFVLVAGVLAKIDLKCVLCTKAERRKLHEPIRGLIPIFAQLKASAAYFRKEHAAKRCDEAQGWAQAMDEAADYVEREIRVALAHPLWLPILTRIRDPRRRTARAYAILLARETRRLYGRVLYGTVAITTTVALALPEGEEVTIREVRTWCPRKLHHVLKL